MPGAAPREDCFVWNVIFTPGTFRYLVYFTRSLLAMADARVRVVANGCSHDEVQLMRAFTALHGERAEVVEIPGATLVAHGVALNSLYDSYDDGEYFCFIDTDVKATDRFMPMLQDALDDCAIVTSGKPAWTDDTTLPPGARDLAGRHFVDADGFVYGSSYTALYRRSAVDALRARWPVTFEAYAHGRLPQAVQDRLAAMGRQFDLYDTAKVCNILMQGEGQHVSYVDHRALFHIGGISQYVSRAARPSPIAPTGQAVVRWNFARWAAATLVALVDGDSPPEPADEIALPSARATRHELEDLVARYRPE
jgi:hypothetical protein